MNPVGPKPISPALQAAIARRQGGGQPQGAPQAPQGQPPTPGPSMPPPGAAPMAPTSAMPFDPAEIKMIEGALTNRLKSITDAQYPKPVKPAPAPTPSPVSPMGGQ